MDQNAVALAAKYIRADFGSLDDLPDELANTIANIYYKHFLMMAELGGSSVHIPESMFAADDTRKAIFQFSDDVVRSAANFEHLPTIIKELRNLRQPVEDWRFKYWVTFLLDDLKYGIRNADKKPAFQRMIERKFKKVNEISKLYLTMKALDDRR